MSSPPQGVEALPRNLETQSRHRREVWWQVFVPLLVGLILIGALVLVISLSGVGDASVWADVSLIWVLLPMLILALIPLVLLVAVIVGVTWLIINAPPFTFQVQAAFDTVETQFRYYADQATEPVLRIQSALARLQALRKAARIAEQRDS